jgi:serine phosphatase RsbU (regulator of sigma subunit)
MNEQVIAALNQTPIFSQINEVEAEFLAQHAQVVSFDEEEFLFRQGDVAQYFAVVLSGDVDIFKTMNGSEERLLRQLAPGDCFGEMSVLTQEKLRSASARARTPVTILQMPIADLENLLQQQSGFILTIMQIAIERFLNTENDTIQELEQKNEQLIRLLRELQAAQQQLLRKEKLEYELTLARQIQESLLPQKMPVLHGWELEAHWQPAREVGGDFYDFIPLEDGRLAVVIGDLTGKGVPAAMMVSVVRSVLRATLRTSGTPGSWLASANNLLVEEMPPAYFATVFLALLDPNRSGVQFANAGHCLPVWVNSQHMGELQARGMPLGLLPEMYYEEGAVELSPRDWVLFYSDGLTEAHNPSGEMYGTARLRAITQQANRLKQNEQIIAHFIQHQHEFTGSNWEPEDDLTMLVLRRI